MKRTISTPTILLTLITLTFSSTAKAQVSQPANVPEGLSSQVAENLNKQRLILVNQGNALRQQIDNHDQKCSSVPEGSSLAAECRDNQASLVAQVQSYNKAVDDFNSTLEHVAGEWKEKSKSCQMITQQAQMDRAQIERQLRTNELSQEELGEWNKLNAKAQNDAVAASAQFVLGEFVADIDPVRKSVSKVERQATELANKVTKSRKNSTRLKYVAQLESLLDHLEPMQGNLFDKMVVNTGLEAGNTWILARDTMYHEFRVARKHNLAIQELLRDPEFKEAFAGEDTDTPGMDVLFALTDEAVQETGKALVGLEQYERFTGPSIRAAVFVRDASYSALLSYFSTQRVLQQSDLAADLAKSAAILQQRYKKSIEALRDCRQAGFSK